jgi:quinol monooxygenase YgiN
MSVTRINEFQAVEGKAGDLKTLVESFLPIIQASPGCQSCQLLQSEDDPHRLVILEVWDNPESHQASLSKVPPQTFQQAMALLANRPRGGYYR